MDKKPTGSISFISYDKPSITDGVYDLSVSQGLSINNDGINAANTTKKLKLAIQGPRFSLDPQLVTGKFPPDKSFGRYYTVLPHIIFKRPILPWERKISTDSSYEGMPWLALLLFTKDENISSQTITLESLHNSPVGNSGQFPQFKNEPGQQDSDRVMVIDVPGSVLKTALPTKDALPYLAHVRKSADQADAPEYAILVCARLAQADQECTVYLVSLAERSDLFDNLDPQHTYRLVTLSSWSFASTKNAVNFTDLMLAAHQHNTDQDNTQTSSNVLRMPKLDPTDVSSASTNKQINSLYDQGLVPLKHQTKQGNQLVSWFRGPLLPGPTTPAVNFAELSVTASDQLVRYDSRLGMFDVSYAAAWELGRLLMIRRRGISVAFFNWKRASLQASTSGGTRHLPLTQKRPPQFPDSLNDWFVGLGKLNDVPYNYLVPDERELPQPSLRFFTIDSDWISYLLDGAFSIGRVVTNKPSVDAPLRTKIPLPGPMSGFLLRSPVVSGWPHLEVTGYNVAGAGTAYLPEGATEANKLPILRLEKIAPDTLFCLFDGLVQSVDFNEKAEVIHFGVAYEDGTGASKTPCYYKVRRDPTTGDEYSVDRSKDVSQSDTKGEWVSVPFINRESGLIDIELLKKDLETASNKALPPNLFAFEMVEGVSKVRIVPMAN